jgi:predicted AlkP superfamily phosphohydrolase/phosphomutase
MGLGKHFTLVVFLILVALGELSAQSVRGRTIVLGFDGLDGNEVLRRVEAGELPAFAALRETGSLGTLATTEPAQSPVSWSSMITGLHPHRTGIDGFLQREFRDGEVRVRLSLGRRETERGGFAGRGRRRWILGIPLVVVLLGSVYQWRRRRRLAGLLSTLVALALGAALWASEYAIPDGFPVAINGRAGTTYWERLDQAGVSTSTVLAPCSFPALRLEQGRLVCGFGVPDVRGTVGFWTLWDEAQISERTSETGGRLVPLRLERSLDTASWRAQAELLGPPDLLDDAAAARRATRTAIEFRHDADQGLRVKSSLGEVGLDGDRGWTQPLPVEFEMSLLLKVRGYVRFRLVSPGPDVQIYADPVHFDPERLPPGLALASPPEHGAHLAAEFGPWETTGWATATNALKDRALDEVGFLADAERVWDEQEALALHELSDPKAQVVTAVFSVPDRIQHMFTRYDWEKETLDGNDVPPEFRGAIDAAYRRADAFVARVLRDHVGPRDLLVVASDHGFAPFRRAVNLNRFLVDEGLLILKRPTTARSLHDNLRTGDALGEVDWSRTRAYSLGLGKIYLNRAGREPRGIVAPDEVPALLTQIESGLRQLRDAGAEVVSSLVRGEDLYGAGEIQGGPADLYVGFHRGWRISWQACLGGAHEPLLSDNRNAWSGDHCGVDPRLVPGVIASNRPLKIDAARVVDIAATILDRHGLTFETLDGQSLLLP